MSELADTIDLLYAVVLYLCVLQHLSLERIFKKKSRLLNYSLCNYYADQNDPDD